MAADEEKRPDESGPDEEEVQPKVRKLTRKEIESVVESSVIKGNVRAPQMVFSMVSEHFNLSIKSKNSVRKVVEGHYDTVVKRILGSLILTMIKEGTEDFKTIAVKVRKEKYSIEDSAIMELVREQKKAYRDAVSQGVRGKIQADNEIKQESVRDLQKREAAVEQYKKGLRSSVSEIFVKQKGRFLQSLEKQYHLEYGREVVQNSKRVVLHTGVYLGREVRLKTIFLTEISNKVENVVLMFKRVSPTDKRIVSFDVEKMEARWSGEKGLLACKRNLVALNKLMTFKDFTSLEWFLQNVLMNAEDLPPGVTTFLKEHFFPYLDKVEAELTEEYLHEFVEKKYYQSNKKI
jgi:hypothetical protein